jgi:hypothetical protein
MGDYIIEYHHCERSEAISWWLRKLQGTATSLRVSQ